jgi:hypothetical protein
MGEWRRLCAVAGPFEKHRAELVLDAGDASAKRRLGNSQFAGGSSYSTRPADFDDLPYLANVDFPFVIQARTSSRE